MKSNWKASVFFYNFTSHLLSLPISQLTTISTHRYHFCLFFHCGCKPDITSSVQSQPTRGKFDPLPAAHWCMLHVLSAQPFWEIGKSPVGCWEVSGRGGKWTDCLLNWPHFISIPKHKFQEGFFFPPSFNDLKNVFDFCSHISKWHRIDVGICGSGIHSCWE